MKKLIQKFQQLTDREELSPKNKRDLNEIIIQTKLQNEKKK